MPFLSSFLRRAARRLCSCTSFKLQLFVCVRQLRTVVGSSPVCTYVKKNAVLRRTLGSHITATRDTYIEVSKNQKSNYLVLAGFPHSTVYSTLSKCLISILNIVRFGLRKLLSETPANHFFSFWWKIREIDSFFFIRKSKLTTWKSNFSYFDGGGCCLKSKASSQQLLS